jgi:hypothetical protein
MAECLSYFAYRAFRLNGNNWILLGVLLVR